MDEAVPDATADGSMKIPVEVSTPYVEAGLRAIQTAQSADVMWADQEDVHPYKLERTS
ncbi:MAG: hypothetical protein GWO22_13325, partial [Actinobacteria bacterium]|nr:hypothetical protein [Actinomycetota bacterium]